MASRTPSDPDALDRAVRIHVFRESADTARVPTPADLALALGRAQEEIEDSLRRLAAARVVILAPGTATIWAANPFCATPSNFRVEALGRTYWGICI